MPEKYHSILKHNQRQKPIKFLFVIYADTESLLEKINACDSNPEKLFTPKIDK